jgi:aspartate aminotransferase/aminotransferase
MHDHWIADRLKKIEVSGIRKVFELAAHLKDPVNLSIGQPHFPVPVPIKNAAKAAIDQDKSGYTMSQGIPELRAKLIADVRARHPSPSGRAAVSEGDRELLVTSGTSGGLVLALQCVLNPGDEVIFFDPYFVMYPHLVTLAGGKSVIIDSYPDFRLDVNKVKDAITPKTKAIIVNSPGNPTGVVHARSGLRDLALLARERNVLLISDEVYRAYCYDEPFASPLEFNDDTLVLDGFSKAYGMTGWRLGYAHGPRRLIEEMIKLQQFTFVCAPSMVQHGAVAAWDCDISGIVADYKKKRDRLVAALCDLYDMTVPSGAFYLFAKTPWGSGADFVAEAIRNNLLIIPGSAFSGRDTHFRLSYAATDQTLDRGIEILQRIARTLAV